MQRNILYATSSLGLAAAMLLGGSAALAQEAAAGPAALEEVVVTARKRSESLISVPVAVTALGGEQLKQQSLDSFGAISTLVPSLQVGQVSGGLGGSIQLRGVGTPAGSNASFEQTVVVNIDGIQLSRGSALRLGQNDMGQLEVLRGPQALFFGKNSPAGVISITTADPTTEPFFEARAGYEFYAREKKVDLVASGPVTDTFGARLALSFSSLDGWMENIAGRAAPAANAIRPGSVTALTSRGPQQDYMFGRGSVKWEPTDRLSVRGKLSFAKVDGIAFQQGNNQRIYCPNGLANNNGQASALNGGVANPALAAALSVDDCTANKYYAHGNINPAFLVGATENVGGSEGRGDYKQVLGSVQADYKLDSLTLTSITGYAMVQEFRADTYSYSPADGASNVDFAGRTRYEQTSEELRAATTFKGPLNALLGLYVEDSELTTYTRQFYPLTAGGGPIFNYTLPGSTVSAFGQLIWNITDQLELSGGARWSREKKKIGLTRNGVIQPVLRSNATFEDVSPEATLTWRPHSNLTAYASYKQGFKSGGFAAALTAGAAIAPPGTDVLFRPEEVEGYEVGLKTSLLDGGLRLNLAAYNYDYVDLQVNSLDNSSGVPVIKVTNAAGAKVKGIEADFTWLPMGNRDFDIHGAVTYNDATYTEFLSSCYIGQTVAQGCNRGLNPATGRYLAQSLAGKNLINAPKWAASLGTALERDLGSSGFTLRVTGDLSYRSEYNPHPELAPGALQKAATFVNASVRLSRPDAGWDVAVIGRNLTDVYRAQNATNVPLTGNAAQTGGVTLGGLADLAGGINRGREVLLQVTYRPNWW